MLNSMSPTEEVSSLDVFLQSCSSPSNFLNEPINPLIHPQWSAPDAKSLLHWHAVLARMLQSSQEMPQSLIIAAKSARNLIVSDTRA
jgi:hypothetical protein